MNSRTMLTEREAISQDITKCHFSGNKEKQDL